MKAAVLAVGSELLAGQITNRNAAWISERLLNVGIETTTHMTVDDIETDIRAGLDHMATQADLIFVTGGLGPTSDDLTRQAVAHWAKVKLQFDALSWQHIEAMFARFNRHVPETNRQQCYFPKGALVLENAAGTANAFALTTGAKRLWVLPGPPREVESVWEAHVETALRNLIPLQDRRALRMWRTIGNGESHLAELVEPIARATPGAEIAYRAHAPFVEIKLRFPVAKEADFAATCDKLDKALAPWLYETGRESVPLQLARCLTRKGLVNLYDGVSQGHLLELLAPALRAEPPAKTRLAVATAWEDQEAPRAFIQSMLATESESEIQLIVAGDQQAGLWAAGARIGSEQTVIERPYPYTGEAMRERNRRAVGALALKAWLEMLKIRPDLQQPSVAGV